MSCSTPFMQSISHVSLDVTNRHAHNKRQIKQVTRCMKKIPLTGNQANGRFVLVDDEDYETLNHWKWRYHFGYAARGQYSHMERGRTRNKTVRMHRQIMAAPKGVLVDHVNGDTLDNRRVNLRLATRADNNRNVGIRRDNSTGYKGVIAYRWGSFGAYIRADGVRRHLGSFPTARDAAIAYNEAAIELFGEFAKLNEVSR